MDRRMMTDSDSDSCLDLIIGSGTISTLYLVVESVTATLVSKDIAKRNYSIKPEKNATDLWLTVRNKKKKPEFEKMALRIIEQIEELGGEGNENSDIKQTIEQLGKAIIKENESRLLELDGSLAEVQRVKNSEFYNFAYAAWIRNPNTETARELKIAVMQFLLINQDVLSLARLRTEALRISLFHQTNPQQVKPVYRQLKTIFKIRHKTLHDLNTKTLTIEKETLTEFFRAVQSIGDYYATLLADDHIAHKELKALKQLLDKYSELIDLPKKLEQQINHELKTIDVIHKSLVASMVFLEDRKAVLSNSAPPGQNDSGPRLSTDSETSSLNYFTAHEVEDTSVDQLSDDDAKPICLSCAPKKSTEVLFPASPVVTRAVEPPLSDTSHPQISFSELDDMLNNSSFRVTPTEDEVIKDLFHNTDKVYNMTSPRGMALVINNSDFGPYCRLATRTGSQKDFRNMERMLKDMGFVVQAKPNQTAEEMLATIQFATSQHSELVDHGMFVLVLMSQGRENDLIFGTDGKAIDLNDVYGLLSPQNFPAMIKKPKLVIVQACSGARKDLGSEWNAENIPFPYDGITVRPNTGAGSQEFGSPVQPHVGTKILHLNTDDLIVIKSSFNTYASMRHGRLGSPFISHLVYNFSKYACKSDVETLCKMIQHDVRGASLQLLNDSSTGNAFGQVPFFFSTLTDFKKCYLFPGYDGE